MLGTDPRRQTLLILGFGMAYALATMLVENAYYQLIMTVVPVWAVMGLSWNLLSGYSGFVSFGHAAFFGLGAYFVALAQIDWGLTPWLGIPPACWSASRLSACAAITSRWRCWPIRWRCSMCSSGWATRN
jgi:ABC-type branched-subunit amino acid transport system permease subunit